MMKLNLRNRSSYQGIYAYLERSGKKSIDIVRYISDKLLLIAYQDTDILYLCCPEKDSNNKLYITLTSQVNETSGFHYTISTSKEKCYLEDFIIVDETKKGW